MKKIKIFLVLFAMLCCLSCKKKNESAVSTASQAEFDTIVKEDKSSVYGKVLVGGKYADIEDEDEIIEFLDDRKLVMFSFGKSRAYAYAIADGTLSLWEYENGKEPDMKSDSPDDVCKISIESKDRFSINTGTITTVFQSVV